MLGCYTNSSNSSVAGGSRPIGIDARQNFVSVTGVGEGALKNANFWMGRRYYQRHDVHINDFFYWSQRGVGAGVENLAVGPGKLHLAFLRSYGDTTSGAGGSGAGNTGNSLDIHYSDLPVNPDGKLEFGIDLRSADRTRSPVIPTSRDGFLATVEHTQSNILGGYNKLALQYGRDAGITWPPTIRKLQFHHYGPQGLAGRRAVVISPATASRPWAPSFTNSNWPPAAAANGPPSACGPCGTGPNTGFGVRTGPRPCEVRQAGQRPRQQDRHLTKF